MDVNIYIETDSKAPKKKVRKCGYVLECHVNGEAVTRHGFEAVEETYHGATIRALEKALARITKPCEIRVYAQDAWALGMLTQQIRKWAKSAFLNSKGEPIPDQKAWMHIWCLIENFGVTTIAGKHLYTEWMLREMEKE